MVELGGGGWTKPYGGSKNLGRGEEEVVSCCERGLGEERFPSPGLFLSPGLHEFEVDSPALERCLWSSRRLLVCVF